MLTVGDEVGSLPIFELANNLTQCYPGEAESIRGFLDREVSLQGTLPNNGTVMEDVSETDKLDSKSSVISSDNDVDHIDESQPEGLTEEEEAKFIEMENAFLNS